MSELTQYEQTVYDSGLKTGYGEALDALARELNRLRDANIDVLCHPGLQHALDVPRDGRRRAKFGMC